MVEEVLMDMEEGQGPKDKDQARLMIRCIELENFKSYAGIKRIGPFHKRFNAIIGPNGSGKSNVIDAMMFVLGKKATKLRLRRVSDVIHKSPAFPDLNHARVSVHMQEILDKDGDDYDMVEGSEISVTRTASIDNKSEYFINSEKVTFREVADALKEKGIDLKNNRFLILQGEIEMISQMKAKSENDTEVGFLEYFEDIIGTDAYKEQIGELSIETIVMKQRADAVERRCQNLEGPRREAEAYLSKAAKIEENQIVQLSHSLHKHETRLANLGEKLENHCSKSKEVESSASATLEMEEKQRIQLDAASKSFEVLRRKLREAEKRFAEFEKKDVELSQKKKLATQKLQKLTDDQTTRQEELSASQAQTEGAALEIPILEGKLKDLKAGVAKEEKGLRKMQHGIRNELEILQQELSDARSAVAPFNARIEETKAQKKQVDTERETILARQSHNLERLENSRSQLKEAHQALATQQQTYATTQSDLQKLKDLEIEEKSSMIGLVEESERLEKLTAELQEQETEKKKFVDSIANQNKAMQLLMEARQDGRLPGFYGKLGDLGAVEEQYDIAISVACPRLDNYVVETMNEAILAGKILKEAKIGVTTFIPLDRITYLNHQMLRGFRTPKGAKRLFDLVQAADERVRIAFYYACRDCMVVQDLDTAVHLNSGQQKFRVVTLKGELLESSGAMSGGGPPPRGGRIRLGNSPPALLNPQSSARELEDVTMKLKSAMQELSTSSHKVKAAKEKVKTLEQQISKLERDASNAQANVEASSAMIQGLERVVSENEGKCQAIEEDNIRLQQLASEANRCDVEIQKVETECLKEREREHLAQAKIDNAGGPEMQTLRNLIASTKKEIEATESEIADRQALISGLGRGVSRGKRDLERSEEQKENLQRELMTIETQIGSLEKTAKGVYLDRQNLQNETQEQEAQLSSLRQQFEITTREGNSAREVASRLGMEKKSLEAQISEVEKRTGSYREQINERCAKFTNLVPDVELPDYSWEKIESFNIRELEKECSDLEQQLEKMNPQTAALEEYRKRQAEHKEQLQELEAVSVEKRKMEAESARLAKQRLDEFMIGFSTINKKLKEVFRMLTIQGQAELELVDSMDPFSDGVEFTVRPPQKAWKIISNLSGGEKTLSSLSLVLALHHYKPSPLYIMDEIDAALDWRNVATVAQCVSEHTKAAQFLIISLREQMFGLADRLTGVTKVKDSTNTTTFDPYAFSLTPNSTSEPQDRDIEMRVD